MDLPLLRADVWRLCRLNPVSEDGAFDEDDKNTMRLVEGISHPSRAEDVQDLHRLQKSSTKPRQGEQQCRYDLEPHPTLSRVGWKFVCCCR